MITQSLEHRYQAEFVKIPPQKEVIELKKS